MSQYPPGYGQWPDPSLYPYPQAQQQSPYPLPAQNYPHPHDPSTSAHYPASQAAFAYNATQIPGLGITPGGTPSQFQSPWQPPPSSYGASAYGQPIPAPLTPNQTTQQPQQPIPAPSKPEAKAVASDAQDAMEEGELADEDFDDLYEPQPAEASSSKPGTVGGRPEKAAHQTQQKPRDAQDDVFYGAEPGEVISNQGDNAARERSGSYSPYLSPREIDLEAATSRDASDAELGRARQAQRSLSGTQAAKKATNGVNPQKHSAPVQRTVSQPAPTRPQFNSADEAKKEAQKSILRLLPLGVKLQNYIEEGLDEAIVKSLFGDLNLLPAAAPTKPAVQPPPQTAKSSPPKPTPSEAAPAAAAAAAKDQTEERKDRIARLLAAKAAKSAAAAPAPAAPAPTAPATASPVSVAPSVPPRPAVPASAVTALMNNGPSVPSAPPAPQNQPPQSAPSAPAALRKDAAVSPASKAKSKSDKEKLLRKKMDALLKSREAQAQSSATAASSASKPPAPAAAPNIKTTDQPMLQKPTLSLPTPVTVAPTVPGTSSAVTTPAQSARTEPSPATTNSQPGSSIPGLYLSTSSTQQAPTQPTRKRPVAADFVDYSSSVGAPKRPFGQSRQDSLVIDISDEESDDDVEMEVDSPGGHSPVSSSARLDTPGRRGPSIRDYPPLSNGTPKRPLSRTNSNGPRPAKLDQINGEISSLQKKIAELVAKQAKKASSGTKTPDAPAVTPPEPKGLNPDATKEPAEPQRRAVSSSDADSTDLPSAQLISEAASAGLPKGLQPKKAGYGQLVAAAAPAPLRAQSLPGAPAAHTGSEVDRRTRIASIHLPKIEATLLEKQTKLKLLEQKTAQLRLEIEKEAAEKAKLTEELRQLQVEPIQIGTQAGNSEPEELDVAGSRDKSQQQAVDQSVSQPPKPLGQHPRAIAQETQMEQVRPEDTVREQPMELDDDAPAAALESATPELTNTATILDSAVSEAVAPVVESEEVFAAESTVESQSPLQSPEADVEMKSASSSPESGQVDESEPEPTTHANSPAPAQPEAPDGEALQETDGHSAEEGQADDESPLPEMISDVAQPNNETEVGQRVAEREGSPNAETEQLPSFTPYESPLRYFRSYRFHPEYSHNVAGGLRSLTYTNKINPKQALCPNELTSQKCNDADCRFQHFASMVPKDEQILIELGRADEFAEGEEKNRFIGGLRDVLAAFRAAKVRDYDKIGYGIIEFRRKFMGDQSRVLSGLHDTKI